MQAIVTDFQPKNEITTPLAGTPSFVSSGIIKAVINTGEKISIAQIDYQVFDDENFQYVISPYWEIVDGLPANVFQGIPGIDMDLRLNNYYRANYTPIFITERTPPKNREDLWELLETVGLDYYDRFEWLLRTDMRSANDNLIVERRRMESIVAEYTPGIISSLQYGDKLIVKSPEALNEIMFDIVAQGIDVITPNGQVLVDSATRFNLLPELLKERINSKQ